MIRREQIDDTAGVSDAGFWTHADDAAERVKDGEDVRIAGLGVLAWRMCSDECTGAGHCSRRHTYRLTLTAVVAKSTLRTNALLGEECASDIVHDVRHLARAIGAPIEVWAPRPSRSVPPGCGARLITTVQP